MNKNKEFYLKRKLKCPWYIHWRSGRQRCNNKNHLYYKNYGGKSIKFLLTKDEVKQLWFRDKAYMIENPQLSRNDHNKNYNLNNSYFNSKKQNVSERNTRINSKKIVQLSLNNKILNIWPSIVIASQSLQISSSDIANCIRKIQKTAHGFKWKKI